MPGCVVLVAAGIRPGGPFVSPHTAAQQAGDRGTGRLAVLGLLLGGFKYFPTAVVRVEIKSFPTKVILSSSPLLSRLALT